MEIRTGTRPSRWRSLLLYGPLFLVPAVAVFVLVLMQFQGLPPQYESTIVFRLDPHFGNLAPSREDAPDSRAMLDPRAVRREIRSRYRMREAMKDLPIFRDRPEEKQELFLDQTIQALSVNLKREVGENAYLVTVKMTRATHDPKAFEQILQSVRKVYLHYNVDRLIDQQAKDKGSLDRSLTEYERDYRQALEDLTAFTDTPSNRQFIPANPGETPPITKELRRIRNELNKKRENDDDPQVRKEVQELEARERKLNELKQNMPAVLRQYNMLRDLVTERQERLDSVRRQHEVCGSALTTLQSQRGDRFAIVQPVHSRAVESEQTSRLLLGGAAGIIAGLVMVLITLVIRILGNRSE